MPSTGRRASRRREQAQRDVNQLRERQLQPFQITTELKMEIVEKVMSCIRNEYMIIRKFELKSEVQVTPERNGLLNDILDELSSPYDGRCSSLKEVRRHLDFRDV